MVFTLGISLLTGFAAGLLPALRLTKGDVSEALKQGLGRTASDSGGNRIRGPLVVAEVALSLMLLIGAGLLIRSLWTLHNVNPGFDPQTRRHHGPLHFPDQVRHARSSKSTSTTVCWRACGRCPECSRRA